METALKNKIEFICNFCNTIPTIHNGSVRTIEHTNLNYIEPHRIIINNIMFLAFNYSNEIYINKVKLEKEYKERTKTRKDYTIEDTDTIKTNIIIYSYLLNGKLELWNNKYLGLREYYDSLK